MWLGSMHAPDRPPCSCRLQGDIPLGTKVAAALTTGALAIAIASPTDLVKARAPSLPSHPLLSLSAVPAPLAS